MSINTLRRKGWKVECPNCSKDFYYTVINNYDSPTPFFYAEDSNDVLLRDSDKELVKSDVKGDGELEALWKNILKHAPNTRLGGEYKLWSNVKCTHCGFEVPYNGGVRDIRIRIYEPKIILMDNAFVIGDDAENTFQIRVDIK